MKRLIPHIAFLVFVASFIISFPAAANITVLNEWRLGENDPGAFLGGQATNLIDSVGTNNLACSNSPYYSGDVAPSSTVSTISAIFANNSYAIGSVLTNTDNFGLECWVKLYDTNSNHVIVYNGSTATTGWGIFASTSGYSVLYGGNAVIGSAPVTTNVWTDVAFVRTNGTTVLFINGVAVATSTSGPAAPTYHFAIGSDPQLPGEFMNGLVDEVRVFAITNGQVFTTNDLTLSPILTVTSANDSGPNTLRSVAASAAAGTTINFDPGLSGQTIAIVSGPITPLNNIRIDASALTNGIQINGGSISSLFSINTNIAVYMDSLILTNASGGAISNAGTLALYQCTLAGNVANNTGGGAVYNNGSLSFYQCELSSNSSIGISSPGGGAVFNNGTVAFSQCLLSSNFTYFDGGAVFNQNSDTLILSQCAVTGNSANGGSDGGGAVFTLGKLTVLQSTFSSNSTSGGDGGGGILFGSGSAMIENSTFAGNSASIAGGAIDTGGGGSALLFNCTIVSNSASTGGGINNSAVTMNLTNCIVAENSAATFTNIAGTVTAVDCFTNGNPLLAPLNDYGGLTQSMPPLSGSPVIDAGTNSVTNIFTVDQRGLPRLVGADVDIGAVEGAVLSAVAVTDPATSRLTNSAVLNGSISADNQITYYYFEYGETTDYTNFTPTNALNPGATTSTIVSNLLTGLLPQTIYHFQLVASNPLGVSVGGDMVFHTGGVTNTVTTTNDSGAGSLRYIVTNASGGDVINFADNLSGTAILLTNGTIKICASLTINGSALANGIRIDGGSNGTVLYVMANYTVTLNALTITNGYNTNGCMAAGGLYNAGDVTLNDCTIAGNYSANYGGVDNAGTMTLNQCTLSGNIATNGSAAAIYNNGIMTLSGTMIKSNVAVNGDGGGLFNDEGGTATINQCTFSGNLSLNSDGGGAIFNANLMTLSQSIIVSNGAIGNGGGLFNDEGMATVDQCTFSGNISTNAEGGGAIFNGAALTISRSTIVSNMAENSDGGGLFDAGSTLTIYNSTFTGNSASNSDGGGGLLLTGGVESFVNCTICSNAALASVGGGILNGGSFHMTNCIVAGNSPDDSPVGTNCLINTNPKLAPLGNYGGPTLTMPPLSTSPALNGGTDAVTDVLSIDQRGYPRLSGAHVDIGSVEIQEPTLTITAPASGVVLSNLTLTATGTSGNSVDATGIAAVFVEYTGVGFVEALTSNNWTNWSAPVSLAPGHDVISAYAVSSNGLFSSTNSVTVDLPVVATNQGNKSYGKLLVQINPPGPASSPNKVSPADNGKLILLGAHVALTAVPGRNQIFVNWLSGTNVPYTNTTSPTLKFIMASNMVVQANFKTNVFLSAAGAYSGLFAPTNGPREQTNSGFIEFNVTSTGSMSGKINLAGAPTPLGGKFNASGLLTNVTRRAGLPDLITVLQLDFGNDLATGFVTDSNFISPLLANLNVFSAKTKATDFEGQYTVTIPGSTNAAEGPFGTSVGTVKISPTGSVTFTGSLADGTIAIASSTIATNGVWPLYVSLYKGKGSIWSWNFFATNGIVSSNQVPLTNTSASWINGGNSSRTALYTSGFTNTNVVIYGSSYSTTTSLANLVGDPVLLSGGGLSDILTNGLEITGAVNSTNIVLTLAKPTGAVTGFFLNTATGTKTKVTGVLLSDEDAIYGFFLGPDASGAFQLVPP